MRAPVALSMVLLLAGCGSETGPAREAVSPQAVAAPAQAPSEAPAKERDSGASEENRFPTPAELAAIPPGGAIGCAPEESPIFACNMANGKRVAVCGAGEWIGHYRYGSKTAELELAGAELGIVMYSGGGEAQIAFDNGDYRYVVFSRMVRTNFKADEPNYPAITDGIVILRDGKFIALRLCEGGQAELPIQYDAANAIWERQDQLLTDETIRADPEWARE